MSTRFTSRTTGAGNRRRTTPKQRRQQHLLDVTVRSRKANQRLVRLGVRVLCTVVLVCGIAGGAWYGTRQALDRFLWKNPDYRLAEAQTSTDGVLSREEILSAAGIREGGNIFSVKLSEARKRLQSLPEVEAVEVTRVLPNKIIVKVTERRAVAWVAPTDAVDPSLSPDAFLVDARGLLFRHEDNLREFLHLPVIYGVNTTQLRSGQRASTPEVEAALTLLRLHADDTRFQIRTIDVSKGYCMVATDRNQAHITFGLDRIDFQLERLGRVLDYLDGTMRQLQAVNLMVERNVPVTFAVPEAESGAAVGEPSPPPASAADPPAPKPTAKPAKKPPSAQTKPAPSRKPSPKPAPHKKREVRRAMPVQRAIPLTR